MSCWRCNSALIAILLIGCLYVQPSDCGIIKDIYQKITNTNNKTDDVVKQSAPICGSGVFTTPDEASLSPQMIFITNKASKIRSQSSDGTGDGYNSEALRSSSRSSDSERRRNSSRALNEQRGQQSRLSEVAKEYTFHVDNVTLEELERHGFNRDAPVTFLMHGFTSGYPLQAWISAIVEAYTIGRESDKAASDTGNGFNYHEHSSSGSQERRRESQSSSSGYYLGSDSGSSLGHNLFIVNWNYAARGILYPRAVANIPIVASYVTRFINDKLIGEAGVDPSRIQLVGHSLGAHLAGYIGKNTREKLGRIYGLDPAGPCFGAISGPLYPSSKRLAPGDAQEVITVQTNSALLGIDKPLGKYSIFVEGGVNQPGCKGGGVLKSLHTLTWDGGDFDTLACSHSRAPNLLTYRHDQDDYDDNCQMIAYACKDWDSYLAGHCGVCERESVLDYSASQKSNKSSPLQPVLCKRIGLDWQYYKNGRYYRPMRRPSIQSNHSSFESNHDIHSHYNRSGTRRPESQDSRDNYFSGRENYNRRNQTERIRRETRRNSTSSSPTIGRNETEKKNREEDSRVEPISLFIKTGDTQPYCVFQYQIVLELNEPFPDKGKPPMSIILQDSEQIGERYLRTKGEQNSLSSDEFGNIFDDKTYTHLITSYKKLKRVDHATLIFREGLKNGHDVLKELHVNYMSNSSPYVRRRLSSRLCPVRTDNDRSRDKSMLHRIYFKPCDLKGDQ